MFVRELGSRMTSVPGDRRETAWLWQRLALAIVRGNAASILQTTDSADLPPRTLSDTTSNESVPKDIEVPQCPAPVKRTRSFPSGERPRRGSDCLGKETTEHQQQTSSAISRRFYGEMGSSDGGGSRFTSSQLMQPSPSPRISACGGKTKTACVLQLIPTIPPADSDERRNELLHITAPGKEDNSTSEDDSSPIIRQSALLSESSPLRRQRTESSSSGSASTTTATDRPTESSSVQYGPQDGLTGLRNIGNTCFMNSVLQCLSNTRALQDYILRDGYTAEVNTSTSSMEGALVQAFAELILDLWQKTEETERVVTTAPFKSQIQRFAPRFMGYQQQDAQEFLRYLLEGLHEDVNRVTARPRPITEDIDENLSDSQKAMESWKRFTRFDNSKFVDLFVGQLKSTLRCTVCGHASVRPLLGSESTDSGQDGPGATLGLLRPLHQGRGARRRREADMRQLSEAAEMHQELLDPEVPPYPGGPPEAVLASREVPRQAEQRGRLPPLRPGPLLLLRGTGTLQVQPVRCGEPLRYPVLWPLHGLLPPAVLGRVAGVQRQQDPHRLHAVRRQQGGLRALLRAG